VIATLTGQVFPDEYVVLGGHYDSWSSSFRSPGADDNASGTSGVLEVARILSKYKFKRSIIFCAFSAEEYGLAGSDAFVGRCQSQGMNLLGYINMDMIGYHEAGTTLHSDMLNPPGAQSLADFYIDVAAIYLPDFIIEEGAPDGGDSDLQ
jgi:Zn-dependent M28 family amino/carboxypeptidase